MAAIVTVPSPVVMKAYSHPRVVHYKISPQLYAATSRTSSVSWDTGRVSILHRSLMNTKNNRVTPLVLCSAGSTYDCSPVGLYRQCKIEVKKWCDTQCLLVGAVTLTVFRAFQSGLFGLFTRFLIDRYIMDPITISELEQLKPYVGIYYPLLFSFLGSPFLTARSFAVFAASTEGITYVMNRLRGNKEDILTSMATAFGTAVIYSLVSGMRSPVIIAIGVTCALVCALVSKVIDLLGILLPYM